MSLFYLDLEYSNGNFYLRDIFDLTLISERSGHVFHSLINIPLPLDDYVKFLCNITDNTLQREGTTFGQAFDAMTAFVNDDVEEKGEPVTIVAHSGYLNDFPLLVMNCIKNKCDTAAMSSYRFIDTLKILQKVAEDDTLNTVFSIATLTPDRHRQKRFSLKTLAKEVLGYSNPPLHSSNNDANTLMQVFRREPYKSILSRNVNDKDATYNINSINWYLNSKMPISIDDMYKLATQAKSPHQLTLLLSKHVREKTALNTSNVNKIAFYYCCFK